MKENSNGWGARSIRVDVRVVAATNRNLETGVQDGWFRKDLYYRLNVIRIRMPSLRERREDIPMLAEFFLRKYSRENEKSVACISRGTIDMLQGWEYPGNVRELQNIIEKAVVLSDDGLIRAKDVGNMWGGGAAFSRHASESRVYEGALRSALKGIVIPTGNSGTKPWHRCLKKVSVRRIQDFLVSTEGREFSIKSFAAYLNDHMDSGQISYKTSGEYLRVLKTHSICTHNRARSNRSRYRLSERFFGNKTDCCSYPTAASSRNGAFGRQL